MPIIFMHGTSVRAARLADFTDKVSEGLQRQGVVGKVHSYPYGQSAAAMRYGGLCIPGIREEDRRKRMLDFDMQISLPDLRETLRAEPLLELQALKLGKSLGFGDPRQDAFEKRNRELQAQQATIASGLAAAFPELDSSWVESMVADVISTAVNVNADADLMRVMDPLERALTAWISSVLEAKGQASDWERVELKVSVVLDGAFAGKAAGVRGFVGEQLMWLATRAMKSARTSLMFGFVDFFGDVLYYMANRRRILEGMHAFVLAKTEEDQTPITIIAHSLGGIISMDYASWYPAQKIVRLATVGSQVGLVAEGDMLWEAHPDPRSDASDGRPRVKLDENGCRVTPENITKWINVYDESDMLSFRATGIFSRVQEHATDNGKPFPECHSAYWDRPEVFELIMR